LIKTVALNLIEVFTQIENMSFFFFGVSAKLKPLWYSW